MLVRRVLSLLVTTDFFGFRAIGPQPERLGRGSEVFVDVGQSDGRE